MIFQELIEIAKDAAFTAADLLSIAHKEELEVISEAGKDTKLQADKISEDYISRFLLENTGFPLLGEEYGLQGSKEQSKFRWIVDPLDGTLNFRRGIPFTCISIGLWKEQEPVLGVIYDLDRQHMYSGVVGEGAWLNDVPIHVAPVTDKKQAIIATGFPTFRNYDDQKLVGFIRQVQEFKKVRLFGAAALSLAFVAAGVVDAYSEDDIMIWDVAAGIAIVKAAGGAVRYQPSPRMKWGMNVFCASNLNLMPD